MIVANTLETPTHSGGGARNESSVVEDVVTHTIPIMKTLGGSSESSLPVGSPLGSLDVVAEQYVSKYTSSQSLLLSIYYLHVHVG